MIVVDNFLESFPYLRQYADTANYADETNPVDGVVYPKVCRFIPSPIRDEILQRLALENCEPLKNVTMFLRQSPKGVHCPHQAHTDNSMGDYSCMLYLNRPEHCQGGTSLLRHKASGSAYAPESEKIIEQLSAYQNTSDAWSITDMIHMRPNRAFIFDSRRFHRAEPVGGFGDTNENARLVLTVFYS